MLTSVAPLGSNIDGTGDDRSWQDGCPVIIHIFDRIGGKKWAILVIDALGNGPMRFNEVLRSIAGISPQMLTLTLKALERDGLVVRRVFATIPPKVEYKLTPLGRSLIEPVRALIDWATRTRPR